MHIADSSVYNISLEYLIINGIGDRIMKRVYWEKNAHNTVRGILQGQEDYMWIFKDQIIHMPYWVPSTHKQDILSF